MCDVFSHCIVFCTWWRRVILTFTSINLLQTCTETTPDHQLINLIKGEAILMVFFKKIIPSGFLNSLTYWNCSMLSNLKPSVWFKPPDGFHILPDVSRCPVTVPVSTLISGTLSATGFCGCKGLILAALCPCALYASTRRARPWSEQNSRKTFRMSCH